MGVISIRNEVAFSGEGGWGDRHGWSEGTWPQERHPSSLTRAMCLKTEQLVFLGRDAPSCLCSKSLSNEPHQSNTLCSTGMAGARGQLRESGGV